MSPKSRRWLWLRRRGLGCSRIVDGAIGLAIALVWPLLYFPISAVRFNPYDLGIAAYGAARVSDGFIPYVDMYTPYGPGQYYILALLFDLFGTSIEVLGFELLIGGAAFVMVSYWAFRGCTTRVPALLLAFLVGTSLGLGFNVVGYVAMLFATGSMVRYAHREHAGWLISAGAAIGLAGAVRWDFGIYCGLVFASALASLPLIRRIVTPSDYAPTRLLVHARRFATLLASAVAVALPFYAPALLTDPRAILRSVEIILMIGEYGGRTLPWPSLVRPSPDTYLAYAFPLVGLANVIAVVVALRAKLPVKPGVPLLLHTQITTLLGACLLFYAASRPDGGHLLPSAVFALLSLPLVFWLFARLRAGASARALSVLRWGLLATALLIAAPASLLGIAVIAILWAAPPHPEPFTAPTLDGLTTGVTASTLDGLTTGDLSAAQDYNALVDYIKQHSEPDEFIFSGNIRHDKLFVNDVLIYFASERHAGTRDYHMDPGSTTNRAIQQQIIQDLKRNDVRLIVLADFGPPQEPNKSQESSGVTDLDDYIHDNYVVREQFGKYVVLTAWESADS